MDRLTNNLRLPTIHSFCECRICGFKSNDITDFNMWRECDDSDRPEIDNVFIVCRDNNECDDTLKSHPRGYELVPWGQGGPGKFMLLCGDCDYRKNNACHHPDLKANGGGGLEVRFFRFGAMACVNGVRRAIMPSPANFCAGRAVNGNMKSTFED